MKTSRFFGLKISLLVFVLCLTTNILLIHFGSPIGISLNPLGYEINLIALLALVVLLSFLLYKYFTTHKKRIVSIFVISTILFQKNFLSAINNIIHITSDVDSSNDFSFVVTVPLAFIAIILWGLWFDFIKNNTTVRLNAFKRS